MRVAAFDETVDDLLLDRAPNSAGLALFPGAERGARVRFLEATQAYRLPLDREEATASA
jgi:hypothetical protein